MGNANGQSHMMNSHPETRPTGKFRKRKLPPNDFTEHVDTGSGDAVGDVGTVPALKSPTCHEAFVSAANAVGVLYQTVQNSKEEGARGALLKLYERLPVNEDEMLSVKELKRYLVHELHSLQQHQGNAS